MPDRSGSIHELRSAVIVGGSGAVGTLLSHSLRSSGVEVLIADAHYPEPEDGVKSFAFLQCDVAAESPELRQVIARADALFVCLPEKVTTQAFPFLASAISDDSLWVDTLSVKTDVAGMLSEMGGRFQAISINPMFAPRVGWKGQCVAIVELIGGPKASILKEFLRQWGARLEETTAGEHDRLTGLIQVATHAAILSVGAALLSTNLELDRVLRFATPPHKLLLLLIHRLTTQSPEVYWDVQAFHPFGYGVRDQLIAALRAIQEDAKSEDQTRFFGLLGDLRKLLKDQEDLFVQWTKKALTI